MVRCIFLCIKGLYIYIYIKNYKFYFLPSQEPSNKRVRPLSKVSSLVNLMSPSKNGAVRRFGQTLQVNSQNLNEWSSANLKLKSVDFSLLMSFSIVNVTAQWQQITGDVPQNWKQIDRSHSDQTEKQHAVVWDSGCPPEKHFLHQRDQKTGGCVLYFFFF